MNRNLQRKNVDIGGGITAMSGGGSTTIVDNLTSTSKTSALSANMGRELKSLVDGKGTYSKPSGGIPKTDLADSVQKSLEKADTALQPSSISDMETKTHASQTYQPIGSYATTAELKTVSDKLDEIYDDYLEANSLI